LIDHAQSDLDDVLTGLNYDLTPEESAFLQSILRFSKSRFEQVRDALLPLRVMEGPAARLAGLASTVVAGGAGGCHDTGAGGISGSRSIFGGCRRRWPRLRVTG
jgi:hypothetical protein